MTPRTAQRRPAAPDGTRHAAYGGVATCGSVWSCPQCAAKVATRRADELSDVIRVVDGLGGSTFMVTLTMRHTSRDRLGWTRDQRRQASRLTERLSDHRRHLEAGTERPGEAEQATADQAALDGLMVERGVWDAVSDGWAAVTSGRRWVADQQSHGGLLGWAKVVEVTHGSNGWHCHVHALLSFAGEATEDEVRPIVERMFHRWRRALEKTGHDASGGHYPPFARRLPRAALCCHRNGPGRSTLFRRVREFHDHGPTFTPHDVNPDCVKFSRTGPSRTTFRARIGMRVLRSLAVVTRMSDVGFPAAPAEHGVEEPPAPPDAVALALAPPAAPPRLPARGATPAAVAACAARRERPPHTRRAVYRERRGGEQRERPPRERGVTGGRGAG